MLEKIITWADIWKFGFTICVACIICRRMGSNNYSCSNYSGAISVWQSNNCFNTINKNEYTIIIFNVGHLPTALQTAGIEEDPDLNGQASFYDAEVKSQLAPSMEQFPKSDSLEWNYFSTPPDQFRDDFTQKSPHKLEQNTLGVSSFPIFESVSKASLLEEARPSSLIIKATTSEPEESENSNEESENGVEIEEVENVFPQADAEKGAAKNIGETDTDYYSDSEIEYGSMFNDEKTEVEDVDVIPPSQGTTGSSGKKAKTLFSVELPVPASASRVKSGPGESGDGHYVKNNFPPEEEKEKMTLTLAYSDPSLLTEMCQSRNLKEMTEMYSTIFVGVCILFGFVLYMMTKVETADVIIPEPELTWTQSAVQWIQEKLGKKAKKGGYEDVKTPAPPKPKGGESTQGAAELDMGRLDLRIGLIKECTRHPDADSLYVEKIDIEEPNVRTVNSGLVKHAPLDRMQNRMIEVLCNLKPSKMRGIMSEAMVMCASSPEKVEILIPPPGSAPGEIIEVEGFTRRPDSVLNPKKKIFETVAPDLKTNDSKQATYKSVVVMRASSPEKVEILIPPPRSAPGHIIAVEGFTRLSDLKVPDAVLNPRKKIFETVASDLKMDDSTYKSVPWTVAGKGFARLSCPSLFVMSM